MPFLYILVVISILKTKVVILFKFNISQKLLFTICLSIVFMLIVREFVKKASKTGTILKNYYVKYRHPNNVDINL
jgi:membrane protein implicated in regulation of membrane protease activity